MTRIGIIGRGNVGSALDAGWRQAGHEVRTTGNEPGEVREVAGWGEVVVLAVPFPAREDALAQMGDAVAGKVVVDVTNAVTDAGFAGGVDQSGAEEVQRRHGDVRVVKAFNTVFAQNMSTGEANGETLSLFVAGDDGDARETVLRLGRDLGFDAVDAGPLENARWLETLGFLNITMGYGLGHGTDTGFRYVHPAKRTRREEAVAQPT